MMISELMPDAALAALLDGKVVVQTSATKRVPVKVYIQANMPNKGLANEFLTIENNGIIAARTLPKGLYYGNLAVTIYCKANTDGSAKLNRLRQISAQCEYLTDSKSSNGFFFRLDAANLITPPTVNLTTGYATIILNVAWHTTV